MKKADGRHDKRLIEVYNILHKTYGTPACPLCASNPYQLLLATILSAQCTDKRVNEITPALFNRYPVPESMAEAEPTELEEIIKSAGFYHAKASNIIKACQKVISDFNGRVPENMDELLTLPGVGRKTANVLLGNAFGKPGFPADTHVIRLMNRIGFVNTDDPVKIEDFVNRSLPDKYWTNFSHLLISHGRKRCPARKPDCVGCEINKLCKYDRKSI